MSGIEFAEECQRNVMQARMVWSQVDLTTEAHTSFVSLKDSVAVSGCNVDKNAHLDALAACPALNGRSSALTFTDLAAVASPFCLRESGLVVNGYVHTMPCDVKAQATAALEAFEANKTNDGVLIRGAVLLCVKMASIAPFGTCAALDKMVLVYGLKRVGFPFAACFDPEEYREALAIAMQQGNCEQLESLTWVALSRGLVNYAAYSRHEALRFLLSNQQADLD
jgi:hypothetical protein